MNTRDQIKHVTGPGAPINKGGVAKQVEELESALLNGGHMAPDIEKKIKALRESVTSATQAKEHQASKPVPAAKPAAKQKHVK